MITYSEVLSAIQDALTCRPFGQKVLVAEHQTAEVKLLDYIEQLKTSIASQTFREIHAFVEANFEVELNWNVAFPNLYYTFTINGFDASGNPVEIMLMNKSTDAISVKTLVDATINAIAVPYS